MRPKVEKVEKICQECGGVFKQSPHHKKQKKFCSRACSSKSRRIIKNCKYCNKQIVNRHNKKYCDNVCQNAYQQADIVKRWLAGELDATGNCVNLAIATAVRRYLLDMAGNACSACGWDKVNPRTGKCPLQIDHVDGDASNNHIDNLRVLCPNCHSLTETFGNTGKKSARKNRH